MQSWLSPNSLLVALGMRWPIPTVAALVLYASFSCAPMRHAATEAMHTAAARVEVAARDVVARVAH